jgi:flagellar biogenesis protein FliO
MEFFDSLMNILGFWSMPIVLALFFFMAWFTHRLEEFLGSRDKGNWYLGIWYIAATIAVITLIT